uniref:Uncharacterized protein n=1 Tax=Cyclopterus lumpus TaxID=8103 RepID=A0A8C2Z2R6_CYCLU
MGCEIYSKKVRFLLQDKHHSPSFQVHFANRPLKWLGPILQFIWSNIFVIHCMDQSKSHCPHVGLI